MIAQPGKNPEDIVSYRPISLLPILPKILEKNTASTTNTHHRRKQTHTVPPIRFQEETGTIEQAHRLVTKIHNDLENKRYCSTVFLDISQTFDKVWHTGLLYKLQRAFPHPVQMVLKSYLTDRTFQVRYQEEYTALHTIHWEYHRAVHCTPHHPLGVPQGSTLHSTPSTREYHRAVSSDPYSTRYTRQICQKLNIRRQQPTPMIQQFQPHTKITLLPQ